jgi:hypothetical protein
MNDPAKLLYLSKEPGSIGRSSRFGEVSPVDKVLERLEGVEKHNDFYRAFCPAHDDRNTPNLDVKEGDDGRVLLICRVGCETPKIVTALGLEMRDLFAAVCCSLSFIRRNEDEVLRAGPLAQNALAVTQHRGRLFEQLVWFLGVRWLRHVRGSLS